MRPGERRATRGARLAARVEPGEGGAGAADPRASRAGPTSPAGPACRARPCRASSPSSMTRAWWWIARRASREAAGSGRPPALIALDPSAGFALGIDFGKRHLAVALADLSHERARRAVDRDDGRLRGRRGAWRGRPSSSRRVSSTSSASDRGRVLGVGMGIPGPVQRRPAWSARRRSCPAGRAPRREERMADAARPARARRQRRQPRRARRVHLGRRARRPTASSTSSSRPASAPGS